MGVNMMFKRCLALLLCVLFLPLGALADAAPALSFRLTFDMDASAYPDDVRDIMPGIADLLNELSFEGLLTGLDGEFDLKADLLLRGLERTRTDIHLFGTEEIWHVRSSLLGHETLSFVMYTLLEFALKGYTHMRIPFQRVAILVEPYVHTDPFIGFARIANPVLFAEEGSRAIRRDTLLDMAGQLQENLETNLYFRNWAQAVAVETGYDEYLMDLIRDLPDWLETFVPRDGITVAIDDHSETWSAGTLTLLRMETDQSGARSVSAALPPMTDGSTITFDAATQPDGELLHFSADLVIRDSDDEALLNLHADGSAPVSLPVAQAFSLTWDATGPMVGGDGVHLRFEGEPTDSGVVIRQLTPDRSMVMLTMTAELETTDVDFVPDSAGDSIYAFAVDTNSLSDLVDRIASPLVRGLLPLIAQAPTSSCQTLMNMLEESGVFGLLTEGFSADEESWDESDWEDEDWEDGDWEDSDWEDGDWGDDWDD